MLLLMLLIYCGFVFVVARLFIQTVPVIIYTTWTSLFIDDGNVVTDVKFVCDPAAGKGSPSFQLTFDRYV